MNDNQILAAINWLFFYFEQNIFQNDGVWPRQVNLIFAFCDYIESMLDEEICVHLMSESKKDVERFRFLVCDGTEKWLKENMKTLVI